MTTVSIEEAAGKLSELIHQLKPGEEVIITENDQAVAKLVGQTPPRRTPRQKGSAKGKLVIPAKEEELDEWLDFWQQKSIDEFAREQKVQPVPSLDELSGDWPEEDSLDEFLAFIREGRR
ncbi:MAG: hypothetical protein HY000_32555 [Planctomycetes bacterium]|nr:hypothetical protein [Planctomycetota bacterium]